MLHSTSGWFWLIAIAMALLAIKQLIGTLVVSRGIHQGHVVVFGVLLPVFCAGPRR
jgi:hypothetical protein